MSADVHLDNVWIRFGLFVAVREANVTVNKGEFFSFLGPSGSRSTAPSPRTHTTARLSIPRYCWDRSEPLTRAWPG